MSGCKSCSSHSRDTVCKAPGKAEKLEKTERSQNPRYPHVFVGNQAIYSDNCTQMIVMIDEDLCDQECDCFTVTPQRILKQNGHDYEVDHAIRVTQAAGEKSWKLTALL